MINIVFLFKKLQNQYLKHELIIINEFSYKKLKNEKKTLFEFPLLYKILILYNWIYRATLYFSFSFRYFYFIRCFSFFQEKDYNRATFAMFQLEKEKNFVLISTSRPFVLVDFSPTANQFNPDQLVSFFESKRFPLFTVCPLSLAQTKLYRTCQGARS